MALTLDKILAARERIAPYVVKTPLLRLSALDPVFGCRVFAKAECMQITGAFKLRGAFNKVLQLSPEELAGGVACASSGNHGRGLAYAAKTLGIPATIVIPDTAPQLKVDNILALGAEVVRCSLAERFDVAARIAKEKGAVIVPPYNDEEIMAGDVCFPYVARNADGIAAVTDETMLKAHKRLLFEGKLLAEFSSAIGLGGVLEGKIPVRPDENVCFVISGGSIGPEQLDRLKNVN